MTPANPSSYAHILYQAIDTQLLKDIPPGVPQDIIYIAHSTVPHARDPLTNADLRWLHKAKNRALRGLADEPINDGVAAIIDDYLIQKGLIDAQYPYAHLPRLHAWDPATLTSSEQADLITTNARYWVHVAGVMTREQPRQLVYADRELPDGTLDGLHTVTLEEILRYRPSTQRA